MNPRERILAMGLVGVLVLVGGYFALFKPFYLDALKERAANSARLEKDIAEKSNRVRQIQLDQPRLERMRLLSLPSVASDPTLAQREYEKYLTELFRQSGFAASGVRVTPESEDRNSSPKLGPKKEPIYTLLPFKVAAHGDLGSLVEAMERFYRTGLLHRIKGLTIQRPLTSFNPQQQTSELVITLTVEAVIVNGADSRPYLQPNLSRRVLLLELLTGLRQGPIGLALAGWAVGPTGVGGPRNLAQPPRQYASIAAKNIFQAPVPVFVQDRREVEFTQFVFLTDITRSERVCQAFLYDRYNNHTTRLRAETGFDSFRIVDNDGETVVRGRVIRIDDRDLIFRVDENYYSIHVGQSLQDALDSKNRLTPEQLKQMGIAAASPEKVTSEQ